MKNKKLILVMCLLVPAVFAASTARAEDEKGFLVNAWEKWKTKNTAGKEPAPARKQSKPLPVASPRVPAPPADRKTAPQVVTEMTSSAGEARGSKYTTTAPLVVTEMTSSDGEAQGFRYTYESKGEEGPEAIEEIETLEETAGMVEDENTTRAANDEKNRPKLSKEKMIASIERRVKVYPQLLQFIPDLKFKKSQDGTEELYYADKGGIAFKIRDLDEKALLGLFGRVNNEATRLNTERVQKQIQQQEQLMRQIQQQQQQIQQQQRMQQSMPVQPVQPPQVYYPPPQPPQQQNVQNPPPQPPQPPRN